MNEPSLHLAVLGGKKHRTLPVAKRTEPTALNKTSAYVKEGGGFIRGGRRGSVRKEKNVLGVVRAPHYC